MRLTLHVPTSAVKLGVLYCVLYRRTWVAPWEESELRLQERLAELRHARGLTLRELRELIEEKTGERMSISYLSELERLEMTPSMEVIARIAKGYDMALQDLIAPVQFDDDAGEREYSPSLVAYAESAGLNDEDMAALARIEFRGHQPRTVEGWRTLHGMFGLIMERTARRSTGRSRSYVRCGRGYGHRPGTAMPGGVQYCARL